MLILTNKNYIISMRGFGAFLRGATSTIQNTTNTFANIQSVTFANIQNVADTFSDTSSILTNIQDTTSILTKTTKKQLKKTAVHVYCENTKSQLLSNEITIVNACKNVLEFIKANFFRKDRRVSQYSKFLKSLLSEHLNLFLKLFDKINESEKTYEETKNKIMEAYDEITNIVKRKWVICKRDELSKLLCDLVYEKRFSIVQDRVLSFVSEHKEKLSLHNLTLNSVLSFNTEFSNSFSKETLNVGRFYLCELINECKQSIIMETYNAMITYTDILCYDEEDKPNYFYSESVSESKSESNSKFDSDFDSDTDSETESDTDDEC